MFQRNEKEMMMREAIGSCLIKKFKETMKNFFNSKILWTIIEIAVSTSWIFPGT